MPSVIRVHSDCIAEINKSIGFRLKIIQCVFILIQNGIPKMFGTGPVLCRGSCRPLHPGTEQ